MDFSCSDSTMKRYRNGMNNNSPYKGNNKVLRKTSTYNEIEHNLDENYFEADLKSSSLPHGL